MNNDQQVKYDAFGKLLSWASAATLALCLWIANDALEKLKDLDETVGKHSTRIAVLEATTGIPQMRPPLERGS